MKILMLIASLDIGGAETHVRELATSLSKHGEDVLIISGGGRLVEGLDKLGVKHIKAPLDKRDPISLVKAYAIVLKTARRGRFDIIHAHSRIAAFIGDLVSRKIGISFVTTVHAAFSVSPIKKYMSRWGYYVSAVSEDLAIYLRKNYSVNPDRIEIITNGVDTARFYPHMNRGGREFRRLLFVSRLDADCSAAAYSLCRIAKRLAERFENIRIDIIGGGGEYERLSTAARAVNDKIGYECVNLLGGVADTAPYLREYDAFVGVSRAALEAMSSGVPTVLAGNEGFFGMVDKDNFSRAALSNFCGRGESALTDNALFTDICKTLELSSEERDEQGRDLREYVKKDHSIVSSMEKTLQFYQKAIYEYSAEVGEACLCGYYGFGNTGDETLICEAVKRLRREGVKKIVALTQNPTRDRYNFGVVCRSRKNPFAVFRAISRSDRLIFGGGTVFQDRTSLRSLIYYCVLAEIARANGVRIELWANGIGPIKSRFGRYMVSRVLRMSSRVGIRDSISLKLAYELGADPEKTVSEADLACSVRPCDTSRLESLMRRLGLDEKTDFVVIALSGRANRGELLALKKYIADIKKRAAKCVFVGMYPDEDRNISKRFSEASDGVYVEGLSASELVALLSRSIGVCSMRFHLLVFADIAGVSYTGIGSDPKIRAFCDGCKRDT